jgi:hypothetical protein
MGAAPENQCHAFTGRQRIEGCPQLIESRECGSYAMDGGADTSKTCSSPEERVFLSHEVSLQRSLEA